GAKTPWSASVSGPVRAEGALRRGPVNAALKAELTPAEGGVPASGTLDASYDGHSRTLSFGESALSTPAVRLELSGVLGQRLRARVTSTNLDELLPAINLIAKSPVNSLPVRLKN